MLIYILQNYTDSSGTYTQGTIANVAENYARIAISKGQAQLAENLPAPVPVVSQQSGTGTMLTQPHTAYLSNYYPTILGGSLNAAADTAAIQAAALAAFNSGGGTVQLPATTIYLTSPLSLYSNVQYVGSGYQLTYASSSTIPDGSGTSLSGGTILQGTGSFPCFLYLGTNGVGTSGSSAQATLGDCASSPYSNIGQGSSAQITNSGVRELGINNFSYGIKCGAQYASGCNYSKFSNLFITNCTQWGVWFENILHSRFERITSLFNVVGQQMYASSSTNIAESNCIFDDLVSTILPGSLTSRGMVVMARKANIMNVNVFNRVQANRFNNGTTITTAATVAATSTITLAGGNAGLAVGMPVYFTTGGFNFNGGSNQCMYFVASLVSTTGITVSNQAFYGAAVVASGTGSLGNLVCQGFPALEVIGTDASSSVANNTFSYIDAEAGGTCKVLFQNASGLNANVSGVTQDAYSTVAICVRYTQYGNIYGSGSCWIDLNYGDYNNNYTKLWGSFGNIAQSVNSTPLGTFSCTGINASSAGVTQNYIGFSGATGNGFPTFVSTNEGGFPDLIQPSTGLGQYAYQFIYTGTLNSSQAGCMHYTAGAGTNTLPAITAALNGIPYEIVNGGSGALVLNAGTGQYFNISGGRTSLTLNAGASVSLRGVSATGIWAVIGYGGTYSAGTISAL